MSIYGLFILVPFALFAAYLALAAFDHARPRADWPELDRWEADTEASIVEALAVVEDTPIYYDVFAATEAARADWDEPLRWEQGR